MSLLDEFEEKFVFIDETKTPDGDGGFITSYKDGIVFRMPQEHNTTIEAQKAEREGTASAYTFLPKKGMVFDYHDIFRRVSDGQYFRVTSPSGEDKTPDSSTLDRSMIKAEKWEVTNP